jgi:hypothetical protein
MNGLIIIPRIVPWFLRLRGDKQRKEEDQKDMKDAFQDLFLVYE